MLQSQMATSFTRRCCSNCCRSGKWRTRHPSCMQITFNELLEYRTTSTSGVETIGFTTSSAKRTLTRTMPGEVSFSPMSDGCYAKNTRKWSDVVKLLIWVTFYRTPLLSTNASKWPLFLQLSIPTYSQWNFQPIFFFRFYIPLVLTLCFAMPALVPWYYWGESFKTAFFVASIFRYVFTLNITWLVNSAAHIWGNHPYEK